MKTVFWIISCLLVVNSWGQNSDLFIPLDFQRAVEKGTRTYEGKPGKNYFQNRCDYRIKAEFDPRTALLKGSETIVYHNNAKDSINYLVFRLYQNYLKPEAQRQMDIDPQDLDCGVDLISLKVNGEAYTSQDFQYAGTTMYFPLKTKLPPGSKSNVEVVWKNQLPNKTLNRMGRYDSTSYFVAYWYPQISVFDDLNGWSLDSYTGLQEFYNEYGDFDVEITLPDGFAMWATGELQNKMEIYSEAILKKMELASKSDTTVRVINSDDWAKQTIFKTKTNKTWHFSAKNVSDFAFGVSNHYLWDACSVVVDPKTKRRSLANAVYKMDSKAGEGIAKIAALTMKRMSETLIGIPYPYPHNTIFEGDFGMEFPMMCNDGPAESEADKVFVTSHEVSHTYFPFLVGTNETRYGWIDEGLITVIPKDIEIELGNENANYYVATYGKYSMGSQFDVPPVVPSTQLNQNTFMMVNYGRAATGFYFLRETMGKQAFADFMAEYIRRWEGKHPTPFDMYFVLNDVTKENWAWFWDPWFNRYGYADLAIVDVKNSQAKSSIVVEKKGLLPVPLMISITFADGSVKKDMLSAKIWNSGSVYEYKIDNSQAIKSVQIGAANIPDAFKNNNQFIVK